MAKITKQIIKKLLKAVRKDMEDRTEAEAIDLDDGSGQIII